MRQIHGIEFLETFHTDCSEAINFMYHTDREFFRVLKDDGEIYYKKIDAPA